MSRCLLLTAGSLPTPLPYQLTSLRPLPVIRSGAGRAGALSICLPLGFTVSFTLRDDSVVFILVQSPDQGVLAAVQLTKEAGRPGAVGSPEGLEELVVLLVREWRSRLLRFATPAQEHWRKIKCRESEGEGNANRGTLRRAGGLNPDL